MLKITTNEESQSISSDVFVEEKEEVECELFVAMIIDKNNLLGGFFPVIDLFLVNNSDIHYPHVLLLTGAYSVLEDGYMETGKAVHGPYEIRPHSKVQIPGSDIGELDMTVWYDLDIIDETGSTRFCRFSLPKYDHKMTKLPLLDVEGMRLNLETRKGLSIEDNVRKNGLEGKYVAE